MKKVWILSMVLLLLLSGCGQKTANSVPPAEEPQTEKTEEQKFYEKMQTDTRPIAVMIDNDDENARPQIGLESAYMVYEMVVEGSATRFMALFKGDAYAKIGPVRSSRHYFLDYALEHDAIYVHAGWSDKAAAEIKSRGVQNINGLTDSASFYRDNTYDHTWHNLYTGLDKISTAADQKGYRRTTDTHPFAYRTENVQPTGEDAAVLTIPYADFYKVSFQYDAASKRYVRYVNGKPHQSQTGEDITAKNIIVYTVRNVPLNDGIYAPRQDLLNVGSGSGYYISEGKAQPITWKKTDRNTKTQYLDENGQSLVLNPGNTFIELAPTYGAYTIS